jgi:glucokinase
MEKDFYGLVDIGGTKILAALIDGSRNMIFRHRQPTPAIPEPERVVENITGVIGEAFSKICPSGSVLAGLGICIAGLVDYDRGIVHQSPNLGWNRPVPLRSLFGEKLALPVFIENDANAAMLGEVHYGAARGHQNAAYITISTGIGCGLYLNGKLYRGAAGFAGELGHIKAFGKNRRCKCGGTDCLEAWASGNAIACSARLLFAHQVEQGIEINTAWVFDQAEAGSPPAKNIIDRALEDISTGLANLVTLLNPTCLVIGGGVVNERPAILAQIREGVFQLATRPSVQVTTLKIEPARLGSEAGIWGMYALLRERQEDKKE